MGADVQLVRLIDRAKLRRQRAIAGLSGEELARRAGCSGALVSMLQQGHRDASAATLHRLAGALGCDPADLMPDAKAT